MMGCRFGSNTAPSSGIRFHLGGQAGPDPFLSVGILSLQKMSLDQVEEEIFGNLVGFHTMSFFAGETSLSFLQLQI